MNTKAAARLVGYGRLPHAKVGQNYGHQRQKMDGHDYGVGEQPWPRRRRCRNNSTPRSHAAITWGRKTRCPRKKTYARNVTADRAVMPNKKRPPPALNSCAAAEY